MKKKLLSECGEICREGKGFRGNRRYSAVCALLCAGLALGALPDAGSVLAAPAQSAPTSESIKEKEAEISRKKKEKESLKNGLSDLKEIKESLEAQKNDLKNYVRQLDSSLAEIEQKIAGLKQQIADKEEEIRQMENELAAAQEQEADQQEAMAVRVRLSYEVETPGIVELLSGIESFGDFLNRIYYLEKLEAAEHRMWQEYKAYREYVQLCRDELELEREILDETKESVEVEQRNLEELIEQKNNDILKYETDIGNKERAIQEYEAEIRAEEEEIRLLENAVAEEKKKLLESNKVLSYDGGVFKFPLASYTRISDDYGMRIHPTLGVEQVHNGVDFAAPKGTAIYAAYDGKVVAASYSATMGNYVMIDHGDGLYTIYMHASALYVKKDDAVTRGTAIAAVGSTGRSTGNHLHFSVRLNGSYVSPWNYLGS